MTTSEPKAGLRDLVVCDDGRDPERPLLLAARLGYVHPLDRQRVERVRAVLNPVGQLHLGLRTQHDLAVNACGQTTSVALSHPPHAHQSVRPGPKHQLLQPADLGQVAVTRCREDPLTQPTYLPLNPAPVNLMPVRVGVLGSTHPASQSRWRVQYVPRF